MYGFKIFRTRHPAIRFGNLNTGACNSVNRPNHKELKVNNPAIFPKIRTLSIPEVHGEMMQVDPGNELKNLIRLDRLLE